MNKYSILIIIALISIGIIHYAESELLNKNKDSIDNSEIIFIYQDNMLYSYKYINGSYKLVDSIYINKTNCVYTSNPYLIDESIIETDNKYIDCKCFKTNIDNTCIDTEIKIYYDKYFT